MKKLLFILLLLSGLSVNAQKLMMNDETTDISFATKFLAGRLTGTFRGINGSAVFNPTQLGNSYLKLMFSVVTVTTSDNQFGPNLIQPDCFHPAKYPFIELFSTSITKGASDTTYNFHGQLKIKGVSKNITIPFVAKPNQGGYDFYFGFGFARKAFGIKCDAVGKEFKVNVRAYGKRE